jgi:cellulose biosynthesis protein BcsQ
MLRLAVAAMKGGTAKTTTAIVLAEGLARRGYRTLLVDGDPQGSTSDYFPGVAVGEGVAGLGEVLLGREGEPRWPLADIIRSSGIEGLDVAPSSPYLGAAVLPDDELGPRLAGLARRLPDLARALRDEPEIVEALQHTTVCPPTRLAEALRTVDDRYDVAVIDCPNLWLTAGVACMNAADGAVLPFDPSIVTTRTLVRLLHRIPPERIIGAVAVRVAPNTESEAVLGDLRAHEETKRFLLTTTVRVGVAVPRAAAHRKVPYAQAPNAPVSLDFEAMIEEILAHPICQRGLVRSARPPRPRRGARPSQEVIK